MFRKSGFQVYLVDDFRTSCRCSNCEGEECSKFREIRNPKPAKNNSILSHGLLLCKKDCGLWNRDENSARNIYKIANNAINGIVYLLHCYFYNYVISYKIYIHYYFYLYHQKFCILPLLLN